MAAHGKKHTHGGGGRRRKLLYLGVALCLAGWLAWMILLTESEEGEVVGSAGFPAGTPSHAAGISG